jgi:hypothetical protein
VRAADVTEPIALGTNAYRCPVVEAWIREPVPFSVVTAVHLVASGQPRLIVEPPLTIDKLEAGRVELTQLVRRARRQRSPDLPLDVLLRLAERDLRRSEKP